MARLEPTPTTIYKLLAISGGVCAFPGCGKNLVERGVFNATLAHITAASPKGPRYDSKLSDEDRRAFENLMYMCPNDACLIDKKKLGNDFTVEWLQAAKAEHEGKYAAKPYAVPPEVLVDAIEEVRVEMTQNNNLYGDGSTQNNNQFFINGSAVENLAESAAEIVEQALKPSSKKVDDTDDDDEQSPDATGSSGIASTPNVNPPFSPAVSSEDEETPGVLDSIVTAEELLPLWAQTVNEINAEIVLVGQHTATANTQLAAKSKTGNSFKVRLPVFIQLAKKLIDPAERIELLGTQFITQLYQIDPGIRALISLTTTNAESDPSSRENTDAFFHSIEEMATSSEFGLTSLGGMLTKTQPLESMSKDLRIPLRKMRKGLEAMFQGRETIQSWVKLVEQSKDSLNRSSGSTD